MTHQQYKDISKWQFETFGHATSLSKIAHLKQELKELEDELLKVERNPEEIKKEFADCFILLFGAAASFGLTYTQIVSLVDNKMEINYKRQWGKPDENGVVNHIKKEE